MTIIYDLAEHARQPRYTGPLPNPTATAQMYNQTCGDALTVYLVVQGGILTEASFISDGCQLVRGAASIFLDASLGKPVTAILSLTDDDLCSMLGKKELGIMRRACATLILKAVARALSK